MFCIVYLNDILVFSRNKKEHIEHLELVIEWLQRAKFYTNLKKYEFFKTEVKYLGFFINKTSVYIDSTYIEAIRDWPRLETYRDI